MCERVCVCVIYLCDAVVVVAVLVAGWIPAVVGNCRRKPTVWVPIAWHGHLQEH
jgi:hypothetical protein